MIAQGKYITEFADGRSFDDILGDIYYLLCKVALSEEAKEDESLRKTTYAATYAIEAIQAARKDSNQS